MPSTAQVRPTTLAPHAKRPVPSHNQLAATSAPVVPARALTRRGEWCTSARQVVRQAPRGGRQPQRQRALTGSRGRRSSRPSACARSRLRGVCMTERGTMAADGSSPSPGGPAVSWCPDTSTHRTERWTGCTRCTYPRSNPSCQSTCIASGKRRACAADGARPWCRLSGSRWGARSHGRGSSGHAVSSPALRAACEQRGRAHVGTLAA